MQVRSKNANLQASFQQQGLQVVKIRDFTVPGAAL